MGGRQEVDVRDLTIPNITEAVCSIRINPMGIVIFSQISDQYYMVAVIDTMIETQPYLLLLWSRAA